MLTTDRAVLIAYERNGIARRGSGMRVGGRYVLTADHCADGTEHKVVVGGSEYQATVHVRSEDADVDIAVLDVPGLPEVEHMSCVLVDRTVSSTLDDCQALGFPVWKGDRPLLAQASGYVPTAEGTDPQASADVIPLLTLKITDPEARGRLTPAGGLDQAGSLWAGMSGAVVVTATNLIMGVIRSHNLAEGRQSLTVTPLDRIRSLSLQKSSLLWAALHVADPLVLPWVPLAAEVTPAMPIPNGQVVVGDMPREPTAFMPVEALDRLAETVDRDRVAVVCAVTGMRGVGKTQVAGAYARSCANAGWGLVGWVNAETENTLLVGLAKIADHVEVADPSGDSHLSALRLREHLQTRVGPSLLVFDNATEPDVLRQYLPAVGSAQIVVTSTDQAFGEFGTSVDVAGFSRSESIDYLGARTGLDDEGGARPVAEELGDLPLALAQAAATIRRQHLSYQKYLERLRQIPVEELLGRKPGDDYPRPTAAALLMSIRATESLDPTGLTGRLLRILATLSPDGAKRALLETFPLAIEANTDVADLDSALEHCLTGSLLTWSVAGDTVIMHRILSRVLRERDRAKSQWLTTVRETLDLLEPQLFGPTEAWSRREEGIDLIAHIQALREYVGPDCDDPDVGARLQSVQRWAMVQLIEAADPRRAVQLGAELLNDLQRTLARNNPRIFTARDLLATAYSKSGHFDEAIPLYERNLSEFEQVIDTDHPTTLIARNNLAWAYAEAGRLDEAMRLAEQNLADRERLLRPDHPDTLVSRNNLAGIYETAGRFDQAIELYKQSLADRERTLGPDHRDTLTSRNNLAYAYYSAGRHDVAIPLLRQNLADRERVLGPDHPDTLASRNNLAGAYESAGRLDEAIPLLKQTLADRERLLGPDHPDTLVSRSNLAGVYREAEQRDEAIPLLRQNLADRERVLGPEHPDIFDSRNSLAYAYRNAGRLDEAISLFEQNLANRERVLGPEHPDTLDSRNNLAWTYRDVRRLDKAIPLFEKNLADSERLLDTDHPRMPDFRDSLARAYTEAGRFDEAIPLFEQNLTDRQRLIGADHADTLTSRNNLAYVYRAVGRHDEAIRHFEQNLTDRERVLGPEHPDTLSGRNSLAGAYESAGRLDEAIPLFEQNLDDSERMLNTDHPHILDFRDSLARAYTEAGRFDEAIPLFEQNLTDRQRLIGADHPATLTSRNNLASLYGSTGRPDEAIPLLEQNLAGRERVLGAEHLDTLTSRINLATVCRSAGRLDEAIDLFAQSLADSKRLLDADHPLILKLRNILAAAYTEAGRLDEAILLERESPNDS